MTLATDCSTGLLVRVDDDLGVERLLVRVRDAGKLGDFAAQRPLVEALDIAADQLVQRAADEHLDERADVGADLVADGPVRRDGRDDHGDVVAGQQLRHEPDPPNVGVAVLAAEAEPLREVGPYDVAVEHLDALAARRISLATAALRVVLPAPRGR